MRRSLYVTGKTKLNIITTRHQFGHFGHHRGQNGNWDSDRFDHQHRSTESMNHPTTNLTDFPPNGVRPLSTGCEAIVYTIVSRVQYYMANQVIRCAVHHQISHADADRYTVSNRGNRDTLRGAQAWCIPR